MRSLLCFFILILLLGCSNVENPEGGILPFIPPDNPNTKATIQFECTGYSGLYYQAKLTLTDINNTNTNAQIKITSSSDPAGIVFYLTNNGTQFTGLVSFSTQASTSNSAILISDGDAVLASYNEPDPAGWRNSITYWHNPAQFGIERDNAQGNHIKYSGAEAADPDGGENGFYGTFHTTGSRSDAAFRGGSAFTYTLQGAYYFCKFLRPRDLATYNDGWLCMTMAATNNIQIKIEWEGGEKMVLLGNYMPLDDSINKVRIPLNDFTGIRMNRFIGVTIDWPFSSRITFAKEEVYLER